MNRKSMDYSLGSMDSISLPENVLSSGYLEAPSLSAYLVS